jgi:hypothetical protein
VSGSLPTRAAAAAAAAGFGALARARHTRALHPRGPVRAATATLTGGVGDVPALARPREVAALLRASRAIGLPAWAPDILGVAIRLLDLHGPGRHQDLLFASSPPPPAHLVLAPARDFTHRWYTALLPYRVGSRRAVLAARRTGELRFELGLTAVGGRAFSPFAEVTAGAVLVGGDAEAVRFDAILHAAPELRQDAGFLDVVRRRSYASSRIAAAS